MLLLIEVYFTLLLIELLAAINRNFILNLLLLIESYIFLVLVRMQMNYVINIVKKLSNVVPAILRLTKLKPTIY